MFMTQRRHLKHEKKHCLEELQCNLVVMKRSQLKVLRLNLVGSPNMAPEVAWPLSFESEASSKHKKSKHDQLDEIKGPFVTPVSTPDHESSLTATNVGTSSISSSNPGASPFSLPGLYESLKKEYSFIIEESQNLFESDLNSDSELDPPKTRSYFPPWMAYIHSSGTDSKHLGKGLERLNDSSLTSTYSILLEKLSALNREIGVGVLNYRLDLKVSKSVREAISLSRNAPPGPPPLCSICQHKAPMFGHPPLCSLMLNWNMLQLAFHNQISWLKVDLALFIEGSYQMVR